MNLSQIKEEITQLVKELMPNCYLRLSGSSLGGNDSLCIHFAASPTWSSGIINNDPGHSQIWIHDAFDRKTGEQVKPLTLKSDYFGYHNYKTNLKSKCGFRNIKKPSEWPSIKKGLTVYFTEMKKCIDQDASK
jgi:hypothetical protein